MFSYKFSFHLKLASLVTQRVESDWRAGDPGQMPGSGRSPGERNGNLTPVFLPEKSHGWRSLSGYSPLGRKESDTTEQFHFLFHLKSIIQIFLRDIQGSILDIKYIVYISIYIVRQRGRCIYNKVVAYKNLTSAINSG